MDGFWWRNECRYGHQLTSLSKPNSDKQSVRCYRYCLVSHPTRLCLRETLFLPLMALRKTWSKFQLEFYKNMYHEFQNDFSTHLNFLSNLWFVIVRVFCLSSKNHRQLWLVNSCSLNRLPSRRNILFVRIKHLFVVKCNANDINLKFILILPYKRMHEMEKFEFFKEHFYLFLFIILQIQKHVSNETLVYEFWTLRYMEYITVDQRWNSWIYRCLSCLVIASCL